MANSRQQTANDSINPTPKSITSGNNRPIFLNYKKLNDTAELSNDEFSMKVGIHSSIKTKDKISKNSEVNFDFNLNPFGSSNDKRNIAAPLILYNTVDNEESNIEDIGQFKTGGVTSKKNIRGEKSYNDDDVEDVQLKCIYK
jgi:hypothetical protein